MNLNNFRIEDVVKVTQHDGTEAWMVTEHVAPRSGKWTLAPLVWCNDAKSDLQGEGWKVVPVSDLRPGDVISRSEDALEAVTGQRAFGLDGEAMTRDDISWFYVADDAELVVKANIYPSGLDYCLIEILQYEARPEHSALRLDGGDVVLRWRAPKPKGRARKT